MSSRQMVSLRDRHVGAPLNIAIVGSGISGMAAAWLLSRRHRVTVFEKDGRLGGHSNTTLVQLGDRTVPVDTGFIVCNDVNYPNLVALFDHLQVPTKPSSMSFAVSVDGGALEYSGGNGKLNGLFGQRRNLVRPRFWSMVQDIVRFYREAPRDLSLGRLEGVTLGDYVTAAGYCEAFVEDHLLPMAAAIWSSPLAAMRDHSAASIVRFFENHGLLRLQDRPQWRTVDGGSREYVQRLTASYADRVRLSCGARSILRRGRGVWIEDETGALSHFDHVVIATHADQALGLLDDPSPQERNLLGAIRYQANPAVLHQDESLMPRRQRLWSSWNYMRDGRGDAERSVYVTYWMNRLQGIDSTSPLFVTLNPPREPARMLGTFLYHHPLLDAAATQAQKRLWDLQGRRNTWFCGAYFGAGFHEDGLQAGLAVAEQLGGAWRPWDVPGESDRIYLRPLHLEAAE
jgi:predicted NAD/FAD-binding protein